MRGDAVSTVEQISEQVRQLKPEDQARVLAFVQTIRTGGVRPRGAKMEDLMKFAGSIPAEDLREMEQAIEEGCEQVDAKHFQHVAGLTVTTW